MFDIGPSLAAARRAKRLELADVEALTRIRQRNLAALEEERFESLPGHAYTRAFLRSYASALDLDADRFVAEFEERYPEPEEETSPAMLPRRRRRIPVRLLVGLASLAGVAAFVAWSGNSRQTTTLSDLGRQATAAAAPAAHHAVKPRPGPVVVDRRLVIHAVRGPCWLLVRLGGGTGPVLYEATLRPGQTIRFAAPKVWVRFGAPWNVDARRAGHAVKGLPRSGTNPANLVV